MTIAFWMEDQHVTTARAAGALPNIEAIHPCGLSVGDTISFPGFRPMAFRVKSRHYRAGVDVSEPQWLLELEPCPHPA